MGRPKKEEKDKKIKVGICLDRTLYNTMMENGGKGLSYNRKYNKRVLWKQKFVLNVTKLKL
jgi:hypothetical protein